MRPVVFTTILNLEIYFLIWVALITTPIYTRKCDIICLASTTSIDETSREVYMAAGVTSAPDAWGAGRGGETQRPVIPSIFLFFFFFFVLLFVQKLLSISSTWTSSVSLYNNGAAAPKHVHQRHWDTHSTLVCFPVCTCCRWDPLLVSYYYIKSWRL